MTERFDLTVLSCHSVSYLAICRLSNPVGSRQEERHVSSRISLLKRTRNGERSRRSEFSRIDMACWFYGVIDQHEWKAVFAHRRGRSPESGISPIYWRWNSLSFLRGITETDKNPGRQYKLYQFLGQGILRKLTTTVQTLPLNTQRPGFLLWYRMRGRKVRQHFFFYPRFQANNEGRSTKNT